jgi:hypothetical protein
VVSTLSILLSPLGLVAVALVAVAALIAGPILSLLGALAGAIATVLGTFALFAALFVLTKETESFKRFSAAFGAVMDRVIKALEPFFQGLMFIPALFDGLISVLMPIVHAFADTGEVGKILFDVLKNVAIGLGYFLLGIGHFITAIAHGTNAVLSILAGFIDGIASVPIMIKNAILGGLSGFLYALSDLAQTFGLGDIAQTLSGAADDLAGEMEIFRGTDLADFLRDMGNAALGLAPDLDAMGTALEDLTNLTYEEAMTRGEILAKEKEASESLTNVPSGFKIAAERFRAIVGEDMGTGVVGPESSPDTAGGGSVYIENISLTAENLADFIRQINELNDRQGIQFTGRFPRYADALNNGSSG